MPNELTVPHGEYFGSFQGCAPEEWPQKWRRRRVGVGPPARDSTRAATKTRQWWIHRTSPTIWPSTREEDPERSEFSLHIVKPDWTQNIKKKNQNKKQKMA